MTIENEFKFKILGKIIITINNKETEIEVSENTTFNDEEIRQIKNTLEAILQLKQTINNENDNDEEFQHYEFKRVKTPDYSYPKPEMPPRPWYHAPVWFKDYEKYWDKTLF